MMRSGIYWKAFLLVAALDIPLFGQEASPLGWTTPGWIWYQTIPGMSWTAHDAGTNYALEWEVMPLLYSFGLTKRATPWKMLFTEPPARFTGSVEVLIGAQLYTSEFRGSHWGFSGGALGHVPLIERGEYLALNVGAMRRWIAGVPHDFAVGGASTLFGFIEYNVHYAPKTEIWVHQVAVRFF